MFIALDSEYPGIFSVLVFPKYFRVPLPDRVFVIGYRLLFLSDLGAYIDVVPNYPVPYRYPIFSSSSTMPRTQVDIIWFCGSCILGPTKLPPLRMGLTLSG